VVGEDDSDGAKGGVVDVDVCDGDDRSSEGSELSK